MSDATNVENVEVPFDYSAVTFDDCNEKVAAERNDYAQGIRNALAALNADAKLNGYVLKPSDFKRTTPYSASKSALDNLNKALKPNRDKFVAVALTIESQSLLGIKRIKPSA
jgi:hypothetical protein